LAGQLRAQVLQWTGIPTCVGFGPTKTLAKLATNIAKLAERKQGSYPAHLAQVCNLAAMSREERDRCLRSHPAGEVWGIGRRIATTAQRRRRRERARTSSGWAREPSERTPPSCWRRRCAGCMAHPARTLRMEPAAQKELMGSALLRRSITRGVELTEAVIAGSQAEARRNYRA
jgi:DNA polymerase V